MCQKSKRELYRVDISLNGRFDGKATAYLPKHRRRLTTRPLVQPISPKHAHQTLP